MRKIVSALLLLSTAAYAQQPVEPDTPLFKLPAVVVNATRGQIRLLDAPLAISVITPRAFEPVSGIRLDQALRNVPGVLAQTRSGGIDIRISIRGFGARGAGDRSNAATTRGIRIMQDGFPETEPDGRTALDLLDLAAVKQIEVIRSNASTLWGNAGGGLVHFSTQPGSGSPPFAAGVQIGGFGLMREITEFNFDVDRSKIYGTLTRTDIDGWRAHSSGGRSYANFGFLTPLGERTRLKVHAVAADNWFNIPGPLTRAQLSADSEQANPTYQTRRERRRNRLGRVGVVFDHDISADQSWSARFFVNPKYLQRSERGTFRDFTRVHFGGSAEYRWRGLTAGVDEAYQDGAILFYSLTPDGERGTEVRDNKREGTNNFGLFAQHKLTVGRDLDLTVGARYDNVAYFYDNFIDPRLNAEKTFARITPKAALLYRLSDSHSVYANLGGGVEVPAGNEIDPVSTFGTDTVTALNPLLKPIRSTTFEIGTKHITAVRFAGLRALSYEVALYQTDVTNEIVPYRGGRFYFTAAEAQRRGAEVGVQAATSIGLELATSLTLSDHRYRDYQVDSVHYGRPGQLADYSDNKVVGVPDRIFAVTAQQAIGVLSVELELQHLSEFFADDANQVRVPGYSLFNAAVGLGKPVRLGANFEVRAQVRAENLADKRYVASAFLNPDVVNGEPVAFEPGLPRHFIVSLSIGL